MEHWLFGRGTNPHPSLPRFTGEGYGDAVIDNRKRTSRAPAIFVLLVIAVIAFIVWQFSSFQYALARMPRGWMVAGASVSEQTPQQAIFKLQAAFSQTVTLHYRSETLSLSPDEVDFSLNEPATLKALNDARVEVAGGTQGFLHYLTRHSVPPRDILPTTTYSEEKLRAFLTRVSERYDQTPTPPTPLVDELRFVPGQPGNELDISASVPDIAAALRSTQRREATLVVKTIPPVAPRLKQLQDLLNAYLKRKFTMGQAGVFIKDLQTGEEIGLNENVAFSGLGLLKLPILTETYRRLNGMPDDATLQLITQTAANEAGNAAANTLLQRLGDGDVYAGADRIYASMRYVGLLSTFIAVPYDQNATPAAVVTPANSRSDVFTNPDPRMQTTPQDTGLLLEMIYLCARGGGTLSVAYPGAFTPQKCTQLLDLLSQGALTDPNGGAQMFIRAGLPAGTRVANKWGFDNETRVNAGIVFTSNGDFVLVILLQQANWGDWQRASPTMADVTKATVNYFALPR
jgi:beta-lactamase class A